eukprot:2217165-Pyramimonas_sp.AAC.1
MKPCLLPTHSLSTTRCPHAMHYLDDNQQCSLTSLFWTTSSRQKYQFILVSGQYAGYALRRSHRPRQ